MTTIAPEDEFLTVEQVAELCHVHRETVRRWLRAGKLPSAQIGLRLLVRRADLDALLTPEPDE